MKLVPVDPKDVPNFREGRRGRVSYPILKMFLETGEAMAKLDRQGMQQSLQGLNSALSAYIKSHNLPVHLFTRGGELYLARTDIDADGSVKPANVSDFDKRAGLPVIMSTVQAEAEAVDVTDDEIEVQFEAMKGDVTR